ncbi:HNH endonuclease [Thalassovita sp.]|uniref:HNH endonuclease n=1 Tax=Thalassovita sp. TaxID=1979401 RepID=UPI002AAF1F77|nr:HNH endonuclease [Thalassovita sp.]
MALDDLTARLGYYCSYCEQPITHAPEIEHVQPKFLEPGLEYSWENFLLGCKSCNTVKGKTPVDPATVAFPDIDNTFRALEFHPDGRVTVAPGLDAVSRELVEKTIKLVKLHRHPSAALKEDRPTPRDKRVEFRLGVWELAKLMLDRYQKNPDTADLIAEHLAPAKGFFSIWMTVFADYPEMLHRFIAAFPNTHAGCFDPHGQPVPRPGGRF